MNVTNVSISVAIMTHPARRSWAERIRDEHPELNAIVVVDPDPSGPRTGLRAARAAWSAVGLDVTHHLVLQDDVLVPAEFSEQLHEAVRARPHDALALFCEWGSRSSQAARVAALAGHPWVEVMADYVPAQALVMPAETARGLGVFLHQECTEYEHDDAAIHRYLTAARVDALVAVPNLVDHLDVPSVHGHDSWGPRPSGCYLPNPVERTDFPQWTGPVLRPTVAPYLSRFRYRERPACLVRTAPGESWRSVSAQTYLAGQGIGQATLLDALLATVSATQGGTALADDIGYGLLFDLWLVGCTLGVGYTQVAGDWTTTRVNRAMGTSVARRWLASTAGGALRDRVDEEILRRHVRALELVVRAAVAYGARRIGCAETEGGAAG